MPPLTHGQVLPSEILNTPKGAFLTGIEPSPIPTGSDRTLIRVALSTALAIVGISYWPILTMPFVADDYYLHSLSSLGNPLRYFHASIFPNVPEATYLRPLPMMTFWGISTLNLDSPVLPHVVNVFLHLSTTLVIGLIILRGSSVYSPRFPALLPALTGMLFFGLHRHVTGTVCWVSARFELMAGLFGTLGLYWVTQCLSKAGHRKRYYWLILGSFACALLSKESAVIFPVLVLCYTLGQWGWSLCHRTSFNNRALPVMMVAILAGYFGYRYQALGQLGTGHPGMVWNPYAAGAYFLTLFWPFKGMPMHLTNLIVPGATGLSACVLLCYAGARRFNHESAVDSRVEDSTASIPWILGLLFLLLSFGLLCMLPIPARLIFLGVETGCSYVPLVAFSILLGWAVGKGMSTAPRMRLGIAVLVAVVITSNTLAQQARIHAWQEAGACADSILQKIVRVVPSPRKNGIIILKGIPLLTPEGCYVFGLGLQDALTKRYNRTDIEIISECDPVRHPPELFRNPPPGAYFISYDRRTGELNSRRVIDLQ